MEESPWTAGGLADRIRARLDRTAREVAAEWNLELGPPFRAARYSYAAPAGGACRHPAPRPAPPPTRTASPATAAAGAAAPPAPAAARRGAARRGSGGRRPGGGARGGGRSGRSTGSRQ